MNLKRIAGRISKKGVLCFFVLLVFISFVGSVFAASEITNCTELQNIQNNPSGDYYLANDIDCSDTIDWNDGMGFNPIGFTGIFDGKGYKITGLYINRTEYTGLFGYTGLSSVIKDVGLIDVNVNGIWIVGGLVGSNKGLINNSYSTGNVNGYKIIGGLVGENYGYQNLSTISGSYSTCSVNGVSRIGGLVGENWYGYVDDSYSTGNISGGEPGDEQSQIGGLVGSNVHGLINNSYSISSVSGRLVIGGLVGVNYYQGLIDNSYSAGKVNGTEFAGGLVGENTEAGLILNSHSISNVSGDEQIGGLVGKNSHQSSIDNSYFVGSVNGGGFVGVIGGLVGYNEDSLINNSYSRGDIIGNQRVGGLTGSNEYSSIDNSYSTCSVNGTDFVGGLVGYNKYGSINSSYWDKDISLKDNMCGYDEGGVCTDEYGKTTIEMKQQNTFVSWDFTNTWGICEGTNYPWLRWENIECIVTPEEQCLAETVSYWKLDEDEGNVIGDSIESHNGTIYDATWSDGKVNSALSFDGSNDYVAIPDSSAWSFGSNNYAVEFWVRRNGNQDLYDTVVSHWKAGNGYAFLVYFDANNNLNLGINQNYPLITSSPLDDNVWYHVVLVRDGPTSTKMYLNGGQTGTTYTTNYNMVDSSADLLLGSQQGGTGYYFNGSIDEVAVYNKSLTTSEIQEHYLNSEYYTNNYCEAYSAVCGNGVVDIEEDCDDNNTAGDDGCSASCIVEQGYACSGIPSICCTDNDADGVCDSIDSCNNSYAPTGMISYWGFEDGNGTKAEDSYDAHDGTLVNGPAWNTSGQVGNALSFDGINDFVRVYDSEDWNFGTNNYTISFWIKRNGNQAAYASPISQWGGSGTDRAFLAYFGTDNKLNLGINGVYPVITSDVLTDNTWYYINVVRDDLTSTKMYLNGVQNGTTYTTNYNMSNSAADLLFGSQQGGTGYYFKGLVDEIAVYNRSLTTEEIGQTYNNTKEGMSGYCQT